MKNSRVTKVLSTAGDDLRRGGRVLPELGPNCLCLGLAPYSGNGHSTPGPYLPHVLQMYVVTTNKISNWIWTCCAIFHSLGFPMIRVLLDLSCKYFGLSQRIKTKTGSTQENISDISLVKIPNKRMNALNWQNLTSRSSLPLFLPRGPTESPN